MAKNLKKFKKIDFFEKHQKVAFLYEFLKKTRKKCFWGNLV